MMALENYCKKCGHRILPTDAFCTNCGCKTTNFVKEGDYVLKYVDNNRIVRNYTKEERDKTEAKSVSKAKEEGKIVSPVRCKWEPAK